MCTIRLHSPSICIGHVAAFGKTSMRCASLSNHSTTIKKLYDSNWCGRLSAWRTCSICRGADNAAFLFFLASMRHPKRKRDVTIFCHGRSNFARTDDGGENNNKNYYLQLQTSLT